MGVIVLVGGPLDGRELARAESLSVIEPGGVGRLRYACRDEEIDGILFADFLDGRERERRAKIAAEEAEIVRNVLRGQIAEGMRTNEGIARQVFPLGWPS